MLCENCKKNGATVHLVEIINQEKKELNLCESCAEAAGLPFHKPNLSVGDLFGLIEAGLSKTSKKKDAETSCPQCGMTLREFRSKGRFGCANDYEVFRDQLEGLLEKIHGSSRHVGKTPLRGSPPPDDSKKRNKEIAALRKRLTQAVEKEEYEEAAKLRDQINSLEQEGLQKPS